MKKILSLSLLAASIGIMSFSAEAKTNEPLSLTKGSASTEYSVQPRRWNRRPRVTTRTRIIRRGYATYRETYRITWYANGRTTTRLISRVRIR